MTTIKILIYTDTKNVSENEDAKWSVSILKDLLASKKSAFVEIELQVVNRYKDFPQDPEVPQKITTELLNPFDEIWFFGTYQIDVDQPWQQIYGGRENELDCGEVKALEKWMSTGGVLMAGDHSLHEPKGTPNDDPETFICMGRALGHRVPRAGQMRKWIGPPTNVDTTSFNTLANLLTSLDPEEDDTPQILKLVKGRDGAFHRLFQGRNSQGISTPIRVFPDHEHEGKVIIPNKLDSQWPGIDKADGKTPKPEIVAFGCDKRSCQSTPVLAVYDGDTANVGRIVADSSWHHYFDDNLRAMKEAARPLAWEMLSQFYSNLVLYLAPLSVRKEIGVAIVDWLAEHPDVNEERGTPPLRIGQVALARLSEVTTSIELSELIQSVLPDEFKGGDRFMNFRPLASGVGPNPSQELVVGSIITQRYRAASAALSPETSKATFAGFDNDNIFAEGIKEAVRTHRVWLTQIAST